MGFVFLTSVACMGAALAAFALHYTKKGPDERGCWSDSDGVGGAIFYCTREMGACNALPLIRGIIQKGGEDMDKPWGIKLICNETVRFPSCTRESTSVHLLTGAIASGQVASDRHRCELRSDLRGVRYSGVDQEEDEV